MGENDTCQFVHNVEEFAQAFVPIYGSKLNVPDPFEAATWNFRHHQEWFEEQSIPALAIS
jgi:hypothetical protein